MLAFMIFLLISLLFNNSDCIIVLHYICDPGPQNHFFN